MTWKPGVEVWGWGGGGANPAPDQSVKLLVGTPIENKTAEALKAWREWRQAQAAFNRAEAAGYAWEKETFSLWQDAYKVELEARRKVERLLDAVSMP